MAPLQSTKQFVSQLFVLLFVIVVVVCMFCVLYMCCIHRPDLVASLVDMYSDSVVDCAVTDCVLDLQYIGVLFIVIMYPVIDFLLCVDVQLASQCILRLVSLVFPLNLMSRYRCKVCFRY